MKLVRRLDQLSRDDARALAYAAADRGRSADNGNPFPARTGEHLRFKYDQAVRRQWLEATA